MSGYRGSALQVEHPCPQCGGPVILEETDRFLSCNYCHVRLYIFSKDYFRYYLPPSKHPESDTIFAPYWRFRGLYFSIRPFDIKNKVLDTSFSASGQEFLPISMGLRTQTLKLKFADSEMKTTYLPNQLTVNEAISRIEKMTHFFDSHEYTGRIFHKAFVGDTVSMIYAPLYIRNRAIYDGVLDRPIATLTQSRQECLEQPVGKTAWRIDFKPALCPDCGWDLSGGRDSVVLLCRNCDSAWHSVKGTFRKVDFRVVRWRDRNVIYLPCWRMSAEIEGVDLKSYADLVKTANLPKAPKPEWRKKEIFFWAPAFRTHPHLFMRLARQMTILQPEGDYNDSFPRSAFCPVTLDSGEAFESIKVTLANIAVAKRKFFPKLPSV
ncbi:MAG TPA: hypothetical protein ENG86_09155, partial [Nitrospirae bacterium]|nr:hypothetical protein [Nitrospirota bacterium]